MRKRTIIGDEKTLSFARRMRELFEYRDLLYFLVWRDIKVRYKQTFLGAAWAILQPFLTMVVLTFILGNWVKVPSENLPYPVFVFCALLPWQVFAYALNESGNSLVASRQLITKVYFPRLLIPLATVLVGLVDFAIAFAFLWAMMFYYGIFPGLAILAFPFFIMLAIVTAIAFGLWFSALNVQYRDVRYAIPFLIQLWFFATPIAYSVQLVPENLRFWYALNPMVGVVEGFRWALLSKGEGLGAWGIVSLAVVFLILVSGLIYFHKMEKNFADII